MDTLDFDRTRRFFEAVVSPDWANNGSVVVVTHLLPDRPFFIDAVARVARISALIPKPKSIDTNLVHWLKHRYPIVLRNREFWNDVDQAISFFANNCGSERFALLDIGGYFAPCVAAVRRRFGNQFLGVVEDTENGLQRYQEIDPVPCPIISVARSPLKNPEDFLVGQSVVFSVEALLREHGDILHGRTAVVIGYGKLGRSIANLLNSRHVRTVVFDRDPVRAVEAMAHGFKAAGSLSEGLKGAGLVFCATGNLSLRSEDFELVTDGAYIATVTSSDDELQTTNLADAYEATRIHEAITRYRKRGHRFYLLNRGQAVNFIHGAAVGPFIYLVQAEMLECLKRLMSNRLPDRIQETTVLERQRIAKIWLDHFKRTD